VKLVKRAKLIKALRVLRRRLPAREGILPPDPER